MRFIDVFVGKVDSAGKSGFSVDDSNFAVRSVVLGNVQYGAERIEAQAFDSVFFQLLRIIGGNFEHRSDVIINDAYVYAILCLFF